MLSTTPGIDPSICLLADHLDMTLAAGEDLLAEQLAPPADIADEAAAAQSLADFIARLSRHEAAIVAHMLQARRLTGGLKRLPPPVRTVVGLMLANTSSLLALVANFGGDAAAAFKSGGDAVAFLRQRGLIAPDAGERPQYTSLAVAESYRIAGVVELGALLDLTATSLDVLDLTFGLYAGDGTEVKAEVGGPAAAASAATVSSSEHKAAAVSDASPTGDSDAAAKAIEANQESAGTAAKAGNAAAADAGQETEAEHGEPSAAPGVTASSLATALAELRGTSSNT